MSGEVPPPQHCRGAGGKLSPRECWDKAHKEHPKNKAKRGQRYIALLRENGHVVARDPGDTGPRSLPCGWEY